MKRLIYIITLLILSLPVIGQNYISNDDQKGFWNDNLWTKDKSSGTSVPGSSDSFTRILDGSVKDVTINGYITIQDTLKIQGSSRVIINSFDTLLVDGNLYITGSGDMIIQKDAVLIVTGNFVMDGGSLTENGGVVVVMEDLLLSGGADLNNNPIDTESTTGGFYVFGESVASGGSAFNGEVIKDQEDFLIEQDNLTNELIFVQPIKLLSFIGTAQANDIQLNWVTAWEENFDFFTIERANHDLQFKAIGTLKGSGNTIAEMAYSFADKNPLEGQAFYRLKATDFDGSFEYHKIISVHFEGLSSNTTSVYPNPVSYHSLKVATSEASVSEVRILDLSGHILYSQTAQTGINEISLPQNIKPGAYLLIVFGSQGNQHQQKIMVL